MCVLFYTITPLLLFYDNMIPPNVWYIIIHVMLQQNQDSMLNLKQYLLAVILVNEASSKNEIIKVAFEVRRTLA